MSCGPGQKNYKLIPFRDVCRPKNTDNEDRCKGDAADDSVSGDVFFFQSLRASSTLSPAVENHRDNCVQEG